MDGYENLSLGLGFLAFYHFMYISFKVGNIDKTYDNYK